MEPTLLMDHEPAPAVEPLCPVFGECGGCLYQDIPYGEELKIKEDRVKTLLRSAVPVDDGVFAPIVPSPRSYHYRNRLDLKLKKTRTNDIFIGFTPTGSKGVIPVDACYIARENISGFIPELKRHAADRLPSKYKNANLTVRTGDSGKIRWGGIGRKSCELPSGDYFTFRWKDKTVFYSLDTFFQVNSSIIPKLLEVIGRMPVWQDRPVLFDLYGGVGLFSVSLYDKAKQVVLIEENPSSVKAARYNRDKNGLKEFEIVEGRVEERLPERLAGPPDGNARVAVIDPPRAGLSREALRTLEGTRRLKSILYLSCNPESLARDLREFAENQWAVQQVVPFDFFPKTKHIETLVLLKVNEGVT